jgi:hypothetical protein
MKNFPDQDPFRELEKRLENYTELPDDTVWKNIDTSLRPKRRFILLPWLDGVTSLLLIGLLTFAVAGNELRDDLIMASHKHQRTEERSGKKTSPLKQEMDPYISTTKPSERSFATPGNKRIFKEPTNEPTSVAETDHRQHNIESKFAPSDTSGTSGITTFTDTGNLFSNDQQIDSVSKITDGATADSSEIAVEGKKSKRMRKRKHAFYAMVTPSLSFQRAEPVSRDGIIVTRFVNKSILSGDRFGVSINAGVQGYISKRFEYYGGLSFYHQNQTVKYEYQTDEVTLGESEDDGYTVSPKSAEGIVNYKMMNVGVEGGVLYHLYGKMLTHKIGAGLTYQQGLNKSRSEEYINSKSSYLSYQIFYRNELRVNSRLRLFVQPTFVQTIAVNEKLNAPFKMKPYRAGLGFGILYGL